ncbi:MAG: SDR family NAD(P)-dependent oxidoreductase [Pseudomonadota bacterium]
MYQWSDNVTQTTRHAFERQADLNEPVAIIGMGCLFPGADTITRYWDNILTGVSHIREVPEDRWDCSVHYDPSGKDMDKSYSKLGGFVENFVADPIKFRIPPIAAAAVDRNQFFILEAATQALADAGYEISQIPRERSGVYLGSEGGGASGLLYALRTTWDRFRKVLCSTPSFEKLPPQQQADIIKDAEAVFRSSLPEYTEDTVSGTSGSLVAGRLCNRLNLKGIGLVINAACASSLAAVDAGVQALRQGSLDLVLAGGVDGCMDIATYVAFCSAGVLSDSGCFPFDERADGMIIGEGAGMLVLKRFSDARRAGDRIYALIRNLSYSSDGRSKGITAPDMQGQLRSLQRTYQHLPFSPATVELIEAHGTGTWVGDKVEFDALSSFFRQYGAKPQSIGLGSVKATIGHLKAAAGSSGLIKTALALYHKTFPPTQNCETPRLDLDWGNSPLKLITTCQSWPASHHPRRAGVDGFGFGGINYHAVLEEAPSNQMLDWKPGRDSEPEQPFPAELLIFRAQSRKELVQHLRRAQEQLTKADKRMLRNFSHELCRMGNGLSGPTLALVAKDSTVLADRLSQGLAVVSDETRSEFASTKGIYFGDSGWDPGARIAFVFPGQGSPYLNMADDLIDCFPCIADMVKLVDSFVKPATDISIRDILRCRDDVLKQKGDFLKSKLNEPDFNHPVMLAMAMGLSEVLMRAGVRPDMAAGHSLGEYFALRAAGVFDIKTAIDVAMGRGQGIAGCPVKGSMAAISAPVKVIEPVLWQDSGYVVVANKNCSVQTVISGEADAIERVCRVFESQDIPCQLLPVTNGFHSRLLEGCSEPFDHFLQQFKINSPNIPVQCNLTGRAYVYDQHFAEQVRQMLVRHLTDPVDFMGNIQSMYDSGARLFIEVGPGTTLCSFIDNILVDKPHWTIACNRQNRSPTLQLLHALAFCAARGLRVDIRGIMPDIPAFQPDFQAFSTGADAAFHMAEPEQDDTDLAADNTPMDESVWQRVLEVVSRRSGYPPDFIEPDFDVEADLAIDSIKQLAIARELFDGFGIKLVRETRRGRYRIRTLRKLVQTISALCKSATTLGEEATHSVLEHESQAAKIYHTDCHRWVCESVEAPLALPAGISRLNGQRVIILERDTNGTGLGSSLQGLLEQKGASVKRRSPTDDLGGCCKGGSIIIVNLWSHGTGNCIAQDDVNGWWQAACREGETWLTQVRRLIGYIRSAMSSHILWLNVTCLGGTLGSEGVSQGKAQAGIGLSILRSLSCEVPEIETRFLDLDGSSTENATAVLILDELQAGSSSCREVGYIHGRRHEIHWIMQDLDQADYQAADNLPRVILAVGGLRGITAAICRRLAERSGCHFIILGRSRMPDTEYQDQERLSFEGVREQLVSQIRAEGRKVAPAEINQMAWKQVWRAERAANLREIEKTGASVVYRQCDIADADATRALVAELQTAYNHVDLVIQGGGDIISKTLEDIETGQFIETIRSKALGTVSLLTALNQIKVGTFVNISSVAGRWNDPGQAAYGAGHEVAALLVAQQRLSRPGRWINIFYGPWAEVGMARLGDAVERMRVQGFNFATEESGVKAFLDELESGSNASIGFCGQEFVLKAIKDQASQGRASMDQGAE